MGLFNSKVPKNVRKLIGRIENHLDSLLERDYLVSDKKQIVIKTQLLISQASVFFDGPKPDFDDYYNQPPPRFEDIDQEEPIKFGIDNDKEYERAFILYMEASVAYLQMFICD